MSDNNVFLIYQLKDSGETRDYRFEPLERLKAAGLAVERDNYNHMYTGPLDIRDSLINLNKIYSTFNINRPEDFTGRSLSMSDVIVLQWRDKITSYYVDRPGFTQVSEFLDGPYKYYSTQRPVDIGTFPKTESGPVKIVNYDKREWVENATFRAWGHLAYDAPLTQKQMDDYELRAASDNPGHVRLSPYQLEAQAQVVGKWEQSKRVPDIKRLTWWHGDFGVFVKKEFVTHERLTERFGQVLESKAHAAQDKADIKPITERLKEGAEQAAKDNAARPASEKKTDKDR